MKPLAEQNQVRRPDFVGEDLQDCGVEFAPVEHPAQDQAHADFGADGDAGMQPTEPSEDAGEVRAGRVLR